MTVSSRRFRIVLAAAGLSAFAVSAHAFNVTNVTILKIQSPSPAGHLYVSISSLSNCPDYPQAYFIIPNWTETTEPGMTYRKSMLAIVLAAHASGKTVSVSGANCYLNRYLLADEVTINE